MNQTLIDAVIAQLDCDDDELTATMSDITNQGADAGFNGFIYYNETCQFARDNMGTIYSHVKDDAADFGTDPLAMIAGFNCLHGEFPAIEIGEVIQSVMVLKNNPRLDSFDDTACNDGAETSILNALAWYALESAAHSFDN